MVITGQALAGLFFSFAAGIATIQLLIALGAKRDRILLLDSKGVPVTLSQSFL